GTAPAVPGRWIDLAQTFGADGGRFHAVPLPGVAAARTARDTANAGSHPADRMYRRFPDKDALLRAVCERFLERVDAVNLLALQPDSCAGVPAVALARRPLPRAGVRVVALTARGARCTESDAMANKGNEIQI